MTEPQEVDLIIFDMDGTLVSSLPAVHEALRRTCARLGWPADFAPEDIQHFFGQETASAGGGVYEFIRPANSDLTWQEVREMVRAEYNDAFRDMARTFPHVNETLEELRKRGYRLALYTNASIAYLEMVLSNLGLKEHFDYIECVQDNGLTKPQMVWKIKDEFGSSATAVVGDRSHDYDAARKNDAVSVGVRYGYGEDEPEEADITISGFDELLSIFAPRAGK
jgi:phosphoglycolate phosphatase